MILTPQKNPKIRNLLILVFLAGAIAIAPMAYKFHGILALKFAGQDQTEVSAGNQPAPMTIETVEKYVAFLAGIAEIAIVFLLWKTVKDFAELAKVSKLQTEVRFRPWVGPSGNIQHVRDDTESNKKQFAISIKNFGEVPSTAVTAMSVCSDMLPSRDLLKSTNIDKFNLGPLLPNMEKRYWIFLESAMMEKAEQGSTDLFVVIYFAYEFPGGKSGYGMISQYDRKSGGFIHRDMWLD